MFFFGERVAYAWSVLMPRNTAQRARLTVEDKSLLRVYGKAAAAEPYRNFVCFFSVLQKLRCKRVKIRVLSAVPQMRVFDFYNRLSSDASTFFSPTGFLSASVTTKRTEQSCGFVTLAVILTAADKPVTFGVIIIPDEP